VSDSTRLDTNHCLKSEEEEGKYTYSLTHVNHGGKQGRSLSFAASSYGSAYRITTEDDSCGIDIMKIKNESPQP
jgi:hypothetical protein